MMNEAWDVVMLVIEGVLSAFSRLYVAFSLDSIIFPLIVLSSVVCLVVPITGRINNMRDVHESRVIRERRRNGRD